MPSQRQAAVLQL
jgi:hypothetical protein